MLWLAYTSAHVVESFLFQMSANDPAMMAVAGYGPAWRASRIDPWTALRHE
jgi:ABC-type lipoprotein release transport system permease subunit